MHNKWSIRIWAFRVWFHCQNKIRIEKMAVLKNDEARLNIGTGWTVWFWKGECRKSYTNGSRSRGWMKWQRSVKRQIGFFRRCVFSMPHPSSIAVKHIRCFKQHFKNTWRWSVNKRTNRKNGWLNGECHCIHSNFYLQVTSGIWRVCFSFVCLYSHLGVVFVACQSLNGHYNVCFVSRIFARFANGEFHLGRNFTGQTLCVYKIYCACSVCATRGKFNYA